MLIFEPLFDIHGGLATHACCCDGLLVASVNHIASCKDALDRSHCVLLVDNIALAIGLDLIAEEPSDRFVANSDERTCD